MNAMNPMLRNIPTAAERAKMKNSGYGLDTIRGMQDQQTQRMRMGAGAPVSAANVFGNLFQQNSQSFMQQRAAGASGAAPLAQAQRFMPIAAIEQGTSMMPEPTAPMPAGSSGGRMPSRADREADSFASTYTPTGPEDPFSLPTPRRARRFAEGGPVIGPGGPKDDAVPAKLSHGEYVLPAEVVQFFGIDRLNKMVQKAKEGSKETPMPEMRPDLTGQMMPAFGNGGMMKPHYAEGGLVTPGFARFEALKNAQSQMPELIPLREQQAADQRMAAMGITDVGGGRKVLENRYGSGFSLPDSGGASVISDGSLMRNVGTPTQPRLRSVPDIVSGPFGTGGAMPDLDRPQRVAMINDTIGQLRAEAPKRRAADIAAWEGTRPQQGTPIPAFAMMPAAPAQAPRQPFLSPSEKDAMAREQTAGERQMMTGMTGMEKRRFRSQLAMSQANAAAAAAADQAKNVAQRQFLPAIDATTGQPIPGRMVSGTGQQMSLDSPQGKAPKMLPAAAKALLTSPNASTLDAETLAEITGDERYDLATRELARRQLAKAPAAESKVSPRGVPRKEGEIFFNFMSDGTRVPVRIPNPTPQEKFAYFKQLTGKDPSFKPEQMTAEDWSEAHYLTTGDPRPPQSARQAQPPTPTFASEAEALRAGYKGIAMINGRRARID